MDVKYPIEPLIIYSAPFIKSNNEPEGLMTTLNKFSSYNTGNLL